MKKCQVTPKHWAMPEGHTPNNNRFLDWNQLVFSTVSYKISLWEWKNQVLSRSLEASKQTLYSNHFTARGEKTARTPWLCLSYKVIQKKRLKEWEWKFTPDKLTNSVHFMVSWALGTRLKEEGRPKCAFFGRADAYSDLNGPRKCSVNHPQALHISLINTKTFFFLYHCATQRP